MRRNILVIFHLRGWVPDGDCLRIKNIFNRLKDAHNVHALFLDKYGSRDEVLKHIKPYFTTLDYCNYADNESFVGRALKFITLNPYFVIKYSAMPVKREVVGKIKELIKKYSIQVLHVWHLENYQFAEGIKGVKVFCDICDSYAFTFKNEILDHYPSLINMLSFYKLMNYEKRVIKKTNTCFVSERDTKLLEVSAYNSFTIPNGVDAEHFQPMKTEVEPLSLMFCGHLTFKPNVQAVMFFYKEAFPELRKECPGIRWYIVGPEPPNEIKRLHDNKNVCVTGFVEDIRGHMSRAQVVICPMISGLGIKNKALEAMAMGKPIVATNLGVTGIICENRKHVLIADSAKEIKNRIIELFTNEGLRSSLGRNARELILEKYSWEGTVKNYEEAYKGIS